MAGSLVEVRLLAPARTFYRGQDLRIKMLNVPGKMAPFIHHTQVARELAAAPVVEDQTLLQFGKLRIAGIDVEGESVSLTYSGREISLRDAVLDKYNSKMDRTRISNAFDLAEERVKISRKDGEPYICHPADVAEILHSQFGMNNVDLAVACFLHDVLEDTDQPFSVEDLARQEGERPARIVELVTRGVEDPSKEGYLSPEDYMAQVVSDPDSAILKCADQFSNAGKLYQLFDHSTRQRLTHKYYPEIQNALLPWAQANGHELISKTLEQWLWSPLTLIDFARHLQDSDEAKPVLIKDLRVNQ